MDASFNIVNLIENNPITKLSSNYNSVLINKIKEHFTETQQQLFVSSFYCYLNYSQTADFIIDLDNVWKWLGYCNKANAKIVLERNFTKDKDYKCLLLRSQDQKKEGRGGHNKDNILLNIKTFKLFCLKADTEKANDIHEYYVKLEEFLQQVVQEENDELKKQLENTTKNFDKKLEQEKALQKQQLLLRNYGINHALVYIVKVKTYENGEYVVKIGESDHLENRFKEHQKNYDETLLLDCFPVNKNVFFEKYLHGHDKIRPNKVKNLIGHENENELFLVGKHLSYNMILTIVNENIKNFKDWTVNEVIKIMKEENQKFLEKLGTGNVLPTQNVFTPNNDLLLKLMNKIDDLEKSNKEILEKLNGPIIKTTTNFGDPLVTVGPRLQKINPETMTLIKVYESVAEYIKESNYKVSRAGIMKAINENTIYNDYRWLLVERNLDATILENIPETKVTRLQNLGYIAQVNINKTKVINVYLDRKTAANENGYQSSAALDIPVKNGTIANGYYYMLYEKCDDNLREKFEEENDEPKLYKSGVGKFDINDKLIEEFITKDSCCKQLKISDKTLAKALDKNVMYNQFYFKSLGNKLKML